MASSGWILSYLSYEFTNLFLVHGKRWHLHRSLIIIANCTSHQRRPLVSTCTMPLTNPAIVHMLMLRASVGYAV
jgi:hypothetical protein